MACDLQRPKAMTAWSNWVTEQRANDVLKLADEIATYLATHRHSADTLDGIVRWWLVRQRLEEATQRVQLAIDYLCEDGVVKGVTTTGGNTIYMLNADRHHWD